MENKKSRKINPIMHEEKVYVNVFNAWIEKHKIHGMRRVRIFRVVLVACHRCKQTKKSENQKFSRTS